MAAQVGGQVGDDHQMPLADRDPAIAAGAQIPLASSVGLDGGGDLYAERAAHSTRPTVTRTVPATMDTSTKVVRLRRNGLNPISPS